MQQAIQIVAQNDFFEAKLRVDATPFVVYRSPMFSQIQAARAEPEYRLQAGLPRDAGTRQMRQEEMD